MATENSRLPGHIVLVVLICAIAAAAVGAAYASSDSPLLDRIKGILDLEVSTVAATQARRTSAPKMVRSELVRSAYQAPPQILSPLAATYTWNQTGTASWATAGNWTPARTVPATDDILVFSNGATTTVTNVPTQFIGQLQVSGNTSVSLQASAATTTLTIINSGSTLTVAAGSSLNLTGSNTMTLTVATGATGSISGNVSCATAAMVLSAADASGITFNNGAKFTQDTGCTGSAFGAGTSNSVVFATGSEFIQKAGADPFKKAAPASVVVFQPLSTFRIQQNSLPSFAGRTYGNLEINASAFSQSVSGSSAVVMNDLTLTAGSLNFNMTATAGHAIKGNITVASGTTLNFNPASAGTINLNGTAAQAISGAGTLTIGNNQTFSVSNSAGVNLGRSIDVGGGGIIVANGGLLNCGTNVVSGIGTFTLNTGGTLGIGSTAGISATAASGNITAANLTLSSGGNYVYNGSASQAIGTGLPTSLTGALQIDNVNGATLAQNTSFAGPLKFTQVNGITPPLTLSGTTTATLAAGEAVTVNTTTKLGAGTYVLIAKGGSGSVNGTVPSTLNVIGGSGICTSCSASLAITGSQLVLNVTQPAPTIGSVNPNSGTTLGGTAVTITGANFTGATAVKFGTVAATTFSVVDAGTITATSPAQGTGLVHVSVTTPSGTTISSVGDQFTYVAPATITSISSSTGGTSTQGQNVTFTATVQSAGNPVTSGTVSFYDNSACSGTTIASGVALNGSGQAQGGTNSLSLGDHTISACYNGTSSFAASSTSTVQHVVAAPTLGTYPSSFVTWGGNATVTPTATPTGVTSMTAIPAGGFTGTITANSSTGVLTVTDAGPAGSYLVSVKATGPGGSTTQTFALTVTSPASCGTNGFNAGVAYPTSANPHALAVGDLNGDGKQDIVFVDTATDTISTFIGDGTGAFGSANNTSVGHEPWAVAIGDFNGDGNADLVVPNLITTTASILLGNGTGTTFTTGTSLTTGGNSPTSVAVGDFNNDGLDDIAIGTNGTPNLRIYLGNGNGTFTAGAAYAVGGTVTTIVVGDFNHDGSQDLAMTNQTSDVEVALGLGNGQFGAASNYAIGTTSFGLAVGDFTNDGIQDLAVTDVNTNNFVILQNTGTGTFTTGLSFAAGTAPEGIAVVDLDGDGNHDLVITGSSSNTIRPFQGSGIGSFGVWPTISTGTGSAPTGIVVGDFNGDGRQDMATANNGTGTMTIFTGACAPTVGSSVATGITTSAATLNGSVDSDGGSAITERGFYYKQGTGVTTGDTKVVVSGTATGAFAQAISGLTFGTQYSFKAYAINSVGQTLSGEQTFTTSPVPPSVSSSAATSIASSGATLNGTVTASGGGTITDWGFYWKQGTGITTGDTKVSVASPSTGAFSTGLSSLTPATQYSFKAYATNAAGTTLSTEQTFNTAFPRPTVQASNITFSSVGATHLTVGWTNGDGTSRLVKMCVFVPNFTNPNDNSDPGTGNTVYGGSGQQTIYVGSGSSVTVTGLSAQTRYYFRVYEFNGSGTQSVYDVNTATNNPNNLVTNAGDPPAVDSSAATNVTGLGATLNGNVTSDSGFALTDWGFYYKQGTGVTTGDTRVSVANPSTGLFSTTIGGLNSQTQYSFKAYATNAGGTVLSGEQTFTTDTAYLHGTYIVGNGGDFSRLNDAVTAYNTRGVDGPVTFTILQTGGAVSFPITIGAAFGASATNTLTIQPAAGVVAQIVSNSAVASPLLQFDGASYVTFDGTPGAPNSAGFQIQNGSGSSVTGPAIRFVNSANHITINKALITSYNPTGGTVEFAAPSAGSSISDNSVQNCSIGNSGPNPPFARIYLEGGAGAGTAERNSFTGNTLAEFGNVGIYVGGVYDQTTISANNISTTLLSPGADLTGIQVSTTTPSTTNMVGNTIGPIKGQSQSVPAIGIKYSNGVAGTTVNANNNYFNEVVSSAPDFYGILSTANAGTGNYYFNTILLGVQSNQLSAGLKTAGAHTVNFKNNIVESNRNDQQKSYTIVDTDPATTLNSDYNDLRIEAFASHPFIGSYNGTDYTTLSAWQAATGLDTHSISANPNLISPPHVDARPCCAASPVSRRGTPIPGVTTDYDGDLRHTGTSFPNGPDIGADEFATYVVNYTAGPNGSLSGSTLQLVNPGGSGTQVTAVPALHYHFTSWSPDGFANPARTDSPVNADASYTANFAIDQFSVIYDANGGTGTAPTTQTADFGSTVNLANNTFARTGYTFTGWDTVTNGNGSNHPAGSAFAIPAGNTTMYAQWSLAAVATSTAVTTSQSPSVYGSSVTLTATVTAQGTGVAVTVGTLTLYDNAGCSGTVLGSGTPDVNGKVVVSTMTLGGGIHTITGCYTGTALFTDSNGSTGQTVNKADQTITFGSIATQTYAAAGHVTFNLPSASSGLQITLTSLTTSVCTLPDPHVGQANFAAAGTCTIRASQGGDGNYNAATPVDQSFTILPKTLTVTANAQSKIYDGTNSASVTLSTDAVNGDVVTVCYTTATFDTKNVGTGKTVTVSGISIAGGAQASNYTLGNTTTTTTADITKRLATWTTNNASKVLGDADPSPLTTGSGDFIPGDGVSASYARDPGNTAGTYHITATLTASPDTLVLNNYTITNNGATFTISAGTLSGQVLYKNAATAPVGIPQVTVAAAGSPAVTSSITDGSGNYSLTGFGTASYNVTLSKPDLACNHHDGILANDASLISQHVVHLITLTPTQQEAANVSGLPNVTSFDASLIAQYLVCIANSSNAGKWTFDSYSSTVSGSVNHDFAGVLHGDVDGDWTAGGAQTRPQLAASALGMDATRASLADVQTMQGSQVTVPMRLDNLKGAGVTAYEFDVEYDPAVLSAGQGSASLEGTLSNGLAVASNSPQPGLLKVVVYGALPATGDGVYVNLNFSAIGQNGSVSPLGIKEFTLNDGRTQVLTQNGSVAINAATGPMFSGRVVTSTGAPIRNARVAITTTTGQIVTVLSNAFGYIVASGLTPGETYTLTTSAKGYTFTPVSLSASPGVTQVEIVAQPYKPFE